MADLTLRKYLKAVEEGLRKVSKTQKKAGKLISPEVKRLEDSVLTFMDLSDQALEEGLQLDKDVIDTASPRVQQRRLQSFSDSGATKKQVYERIRQVAATTMKASRNPVIRGIVGSKTSIDFIVVPNFKSLDKTFIPKLKADKLVGPLIQGRLEETLRSGNVRTRTLNGKPVVQKVFDRGHVASVSQRALVNVGLSLERSGLVTNPEALQLIQYLRDAYIEINGETIEIEAKYFEKLGLSDFSQEIEFVIPESAKINNAKSAEEKKLRDLEFLPAYQKLVKLLSEDLIDTVLDAQAADILDIAESPSGYDDILNLFLDPIEGKKTKAKTLKKKGKVKYKGKKTKRLKMEQAKLKRDAAPRNKSGLDLQTILSAVNSAITEAVRENMGTGADPSKLNYRTGRFAESVQVVSAVQRPGAIQLFYQYQNNPYDVFAPGGKYHRPGRNPKAIIGRSVRQVGISLFKSRIIASEAKV